MLDPILKLDASTPGQENRFLAEARAKMKPVSGLVKTDWTPICGDGKWTELKKKSWS